MHQYKNLLDQVSAITERYKKISQLTGENFNVFRILKLESSEVRMHSAFIAELLNPKGSHGQGDIFLKLFVNSFCFKGNKFDTENCRVEIEKHTGFISEDRTEGGRIDIIITDKYNQHIIIENKIYAGDQDNQLLRYYKHAPNSDIVYLTLEGKLPNELSIGGLKEEEHFKCYSYKNDILKWLELCRKEVAVFPIIREAITHYINLIKYLTNQTLNKTMEKELSDLLKNNIEASFAISSNLNKACDKISDEFGELLKNESTRLGLACHYNVNFKNNFTGIWISKPEWKYFNIGFQFQSYDKNLRYGIIAKKDPKLYSIPTATKDNISKLPNNTLKSNDWWAWYKQMEEPYNNWSKFQAWQAILNGSMKESIINKVDFLLKLSSSLEK